VSKYIKNNQQSQTFYSYFFERPIFDFELWNSLCLGGVIGLLVLHPVTMLMIWLELKHTLKLSFGQFLLDHLLRFFSFEMLLMSGVFLLMGSAIGYCFYVLNHKLREKSQKIQQLEYELNREIKTLLQYPENEHLEFKSSLRWDMQQGKFNKELEQVVLKTIAGFANHLGGSLLIGVDDNGEPLGLDRDYATLKRKNKDGFYQLLMNLISAHLGASLCSRISVVFHVLAEKEIAQVIIASSPAPIFMLEKGRNVYYLRTGNSTRELDAKEMLSHNQNKRK
jgi:hypothetical protein